MDNSTFSEYSLRKKGGRVSVRACVRACVRVCDGEGDERDREIEN